MTAAMVVATAMSEAQVRQLCGSASGSRYEMVDGRLPRADRVELDGFAAQPTPPAVALGNAGQLHASASALGGSIRRHVDARVAHFHVADRLVGPVRMAGGGDVEQSPCVGIDVGDELDHLRTLAKVPERMLVGPRGVSGLVVGKHGETRRGR